MAWPEVPGVRNGDGGGEGWGVEAVGAEDILAL